MNTHKQFGFSLIELTIVIIIAGLMFAAAASALQVFLNQSKQQSTDQNIASVRSALELHVQQHGRLPCPASMSAAQGTAEFGREPLNCATNNSLDIGTLAGIYPRRGLNTNADNPNSPVWVGTVPTRTLNIPDQLMMDGYNRRLVYAVTRVLTVENAYDGSIFTSPNQQGQIGIYADDTETISVITPEGSAVFALFSLGEDGLGARTIAGVEYNPCPHDDAAQEQRKNCAFLQDNANGRAAFRETIRTVNANQVVYDDKLVFSVNAGEAEVPVPLCAQGEFPVSNGDSYECIAGGACGLNEVLTSDGADGFTCTNLRTLMSQVLANCSGSEVLTNRAGTISCVTDQQGSSAPPPAAPAPASLAGRRCCPCQWGCLHGPGLTDVNGNCTGYQCDWDRSGDN